MNRVDLTFPHYSLWRWLSLVTLLLSPTCFMFAQINPELVLSPLQQKEDIHYLKEKLQAWHPNLYLNTSPESIDDYFHLLESNNLPQRGSEFYARLSGVSELIRDGHLTFLPSSKQLASTSTSVIPLHILYLGDKLFIEQVYSSNSTIPKGSEIISINNLSSGDLSNVLLASLPTDGNNFQYSSWILNQYFASYYSFSYGHPQTFRIVSEKEGVTSIDSLQSMSWDSIAYYKGLTRDVKVEKGIDLNIPDKETYAVLKIRDFHQAVLSKKYHQQFGKEIDSAFDAIRMKGVSNLILDLRDNQGGNLKYGKLLLAYLVHKQFTMVEAYYKRGNKKDIQQLQKTNGLCQGIQQPLASGFDGQLYVLLNGGSFSNSAIVASCLKRNTNAIFIGEESGGNRQVLGSSIRKITLPNSKIEVEIPRRRMVLDSTNSFIGEGIKPDREIKPTLQEVLLGKDPVMEAALTLIKSKGVSD